MTDDQYRRLFLESAEMPKVSADFVRTEVVSRVARELIALGDGHFIGADGASLSAREVQALLDYIEGRVK